MASKSREGRNFEKKLTELEEIVARLESGDASLEDSLAIFEKGTTLLKELSGILEEAERKVEILSRDASGDPEAKPFSDEPDEDNS